MHIRSFCFSACATEAPHTCAMETQLFYRVNADFMANFFHPCSLKSWYFIHSPAVDRGLRSDVLIYKPESVYEICCAFKWTVLHFSIICNGVANPLAPHPCWETYDCLCLRKVTPGHLLMPRANCHRGTSMLCANKLAWQCNMPLIFPLFIWHRYDYQSYSYICIWKYALTAYIILHNDLRYAMEKGSSPNDPTAHLYHNVSI
jgi:hypothetical protein